MQERGGRELGTRTEKPPVFLNGKLIGMTKSYFALYWRDREWQGTR